MMKLLHLLIFVFIVLIVGCGPAANYERDSQNMDLNEEPLENENTSLSLEQDSLSDIYLEAFEKRIIQKLEDFTGYIEIISDSTLDKSFREQAQTMALSLFADDETKMYLDIYGEGTDKPQCVKDFIASFEKAFDGKVSLKANKISITHKLKKVNEGLFTGELECNLSINKVKAEASTSKSILLKVKFELKRIAKDFGGTEKQIWEVFLGDFGA